MEDKQVGDLEVWGVLVPKRVANIIKVCLMASVVIAFAIGCISYAATANIDTAIRWTAGGFAIGIVLSALAFVSIWGIFEA